MQKNAQKFSVEVYSAFVTFDIPIEEFPSAHSLEHAY